MIFRDDPNCDETKDVHDWLETMFPLEQTHVALWGQIRVFQDKTGWRAALAHGPLCVASDSQSKISFECQIQHGLVAAILCHICRKWLGTDPPKPTDETKIPINAMLSFQSVFVNFKQGPRQAAAFCHAALCVDTEVNLLANNGVGKQTCDAPIAENLSEKNRPAAIAAEGVNRDMDNLAINDAVRIVKGMSDDNKEATHFTIIE